MDREFILIVGILCLIAGVYSFVIGTALPNNYSVTQILNNPSSGYNPQSARNPLDMSDEYGIVKETVFHKQNKIAFSTPKEFFDYTGKTSWNGLKFDRMDKLPSGLHFVDGRPLTPADYRRAMGGR